ncbi:MAG: CsbD family protein [Leptolyngbyaceae cyanobacterium]
MSIEDRVEATVKNIEGKLQETAGDITGDPQDQAEGQEKQIEAKAMHSKENIKDEIDQQLS